MSKKTVLEHQLEEWKYLNGYINSIDTGYQQSFTIIIEIFSVAAALGANSNNSVGTIIMFIVPPGIIATFAYLSYQFRIVAILRGHLAALEIKMNNHLHEDVHIWNSALVEMYMARNNSINKWMMFPIAVLVIVIIIVCVIYSWNIMSASLMYRIIFFCYWGVMLGLAVLVTIPFFQNERIRHLTFKEEKVLSSYKKLFTNDK